MKTNAFTDLIANLKFEGELLKVANPFDSWIEYYQYMDKKFIVIHSNKFPKQVEQLA